MIAKTLGFAVSTALPLFLVRRLSLGDFGSYKQLFLLLQTATTVLPLGLHMSAFYFLPRAVDREQKGQVVLCLLLGYLLTTGVAGVMLVLFPSLVDTLFHSQELARLGRVIGVTLVLYVFSSLLESITIANGEARLSAIVIVCSTLFRTGFLLTAGVVWGTVQAILIATAVYSALLVAVLAVYIHLRFGAFWRTFNWDSLRNQLSYALPLGIAGLLWSFQVDLHNYFVSHVFGPAVFAIYSTGCFQLPLVGIFSDSVGSVLIPRVSAMQHSDNRLEIIGLTAKVMRSLAAVYFPLYGFLTVMAKEFIVLLFTSRYLDSVPVFRINLLFLPLSAVMMDPIMRAYKEQRFWLLRLNVIVLLSVSAVLLLGMTTFGLIGTIACVVGAQYINRAAVVVRVTNLLQVTSSDLPKLRDIPKLAAATLVAALVAWGLRLLVIDLRPLGSLLIVGSAFVVVYATMLILLHVPTKDEVAVVQRWFLRFPGTKRREN